VQTTGANRDTKGNYVSDKGMPWAISFYMILKFQRKVNVTEGTITL
jgi:hypothetical protein